MQKIFAIALALLLFIISSTDLLTIFSFHLNQDYIVDKYCVNIDEPSLMCYGSCYLEIQIEEDQTQKQNLPLLNLIDQVNFLIDTYAIVDSAKIYLFRSEEPVYLKYSPEQTHLPGVFHPPKEKQV